MPFLFYFTHSLCLVTGLSIGALIFREAGKEEVRALVGYVRDQQMQLNVAIDRNRRACIDLFGVNFDAKIPPIPPIDPISIGSWEERIPPQSIPWDGD